MNFTKSRIRSLKCKFKEFIFVEEIQMNQNTHLIECNFLLPKQKDLQHFLLNSSHLLKKCSRQNYYRGNFKIWLYKHAALLNITFSSWIIITCISNKYEKTFRSGVQTVFYLALKIYIAYFSRETKSGILRPGLTWMIYGKIHYFPVISFITCMSNYSLSHLLYSNTCLHQEEHSYVHIPHL